MRVDARLGGAAVLVDLDEAPLVDGDRRAGRARAGRRTGGGRPRRPRRRPRGARPRRSAPSCRRPSLGVCPFTITPVLMSMPRFLNARTTTLATSVSRPGRILGSPSRIVTFEPRSAKVDANSQPMAPPPITTMRDGMRSSISTSSEVMIGPPTSKPGIRRGAEPAARMTKRACSVVVAVRGPATVTVRSGPSVPTPSYDGDLPALDQPGQALPQVLDDLLLAALADREVDRRRAGVDAEVLGVGDVAVDRRGLEERLGRDAPPVQAGAPDLVLLDQRHRHARRTRRRGRPRSRRGLRR